MLKEILNKVGKFIIKYQKFVYPGIALVLAAVVVVIVLNVQNKMDKANNQPNTNVTVNDPTIAAGPDSNVPLETNNDELVDELLNDYFKALTDGNGEKIKSLCDIVDETEIIRYEEQAKYLGYEINEIYKQNGPEEGNYVAYVYSYVVFDEYPDLRFPDFRGFYIKTAEDGSLYIVNGEVTYTENTFIENVKNQDDVVELNNKINVEYNDVVIANPYILDYLVSLDSTISVAVGERIAELNASQEPEDTEVADGGNDIGNIPLENTTIYATATTNVNVRKSDSAESERITEITAGTKLEVVEVQLNGWTKVIYEGQEAFIKSEYLSLAQSAEGISTIGMMTALDNVNVRSEANTDSEVLGALVTGDQYEIAAVVDGWVTIKFNGVLAYVKAEYCDCTIF